MNVNELFRAGRLGEAISAAAEAIKKNPTDTAARATYCELLSFTGEWEKTDKHLESLLLQEPKAVSSVSVFRQLLRGDAARHDFFTAGRAPEVVVPPDESMQRYLKASLLLREKAAAEAGALLAEAEKLRPALPGNCNGEAFDDFRDMDDLLAGTLELITSTGKYYWIPWNRVLRVEIQALKSPRDVVWRPAEIDVREGPSGVVYLPGLYFGTRDSGKESLRLGKETEWIGSPPEPTRGLGQRAFLVGENVKSLLDIQTLEFQA